MALAAFGLHSQQFDAPRLCVPPSATFRCCPQALKNPHTLSLLAQPERERAKTRLRTAAALTLWASAQTGALLNFQFRFGVAELALGVAYRHIWRQDGRYGEGTGSSADLEYQRAVVNAIQSFSATVVDNKVP